MSKFQPLQAYKKTADDDYRLLPFKFTALRDDQYVLTNIVGEHLVLSREMLQTFARHELPADTPEFRSLKSRHFLLDGDSDVAIDLLALKTKTKYERLANFTALHLFVVTLRCEHSCPYCQVSRKNEEHSEFDMSLETANRAVDLVFCSPSPSLKIEFQGGEPLLNFDLIKHIVDRVSGVNERERRELDFVIATNLAVVTDEMLEFCRAHSIHISTSLDGPAEIHNKNRPRPGGDSHERAVTGIGRVREVLGRDQISGVMTTTLASLSHAREIVDEYVRRGFRGIFLRPLSPYGFALKTKWYSAYETPSWLKFYFDGLDYIIELNKAGVRFSEFYASMILAKMLTPFQPGYVDLMSPAGIGLGALVYNYDGDVYASDESRMLAEMGDKSFRLGNVHSDTYEEIVLSPALLDPLEASFAGSAPMCSTCAFEPYCGAEPVFHQATQRDWVGRKPVSDFCNRNMAIFRGLIERMEGDSATAKIFTQWANS